VTKLREDASLMASGEVQNLVEFITQSKRGILPGPRLRA